MSISGEDGYSPTAGLDSQYTLSKFSVEDERSMLSSPESASEQSEMRNTAKVGRLSRRATFAPGIADTLDDSAMQPMPFHLPSIAKQSSVLKQSGVGKQSSSIVKQLSVAKQVSSKQPSIASQASSVSQTSTVRRKSLETGKSIITRRSSSTLQSKKSLQSMKTAKLDDMLDDYKFAVERKAKPAEVHAGQHALELDAAMKKLTLEWIVKSYVSLSHHIL